MPGHVPQDILSASVTDVRPLASMLRALCRPKAVMEIRSHGIKITAEEGRSIQASAYLTSASFCSYSFTKEAPARASPTPSNDSQDMEDEAPYCVFGVSLSTILECLNIFGNAGSSGGGKEWGSKGGEESGGRGRRRDEAELESKDDGKVTSLRMTYAGDGEPLVLLLEESGIVTRCEITTYEPDLLMEIGFDDETRVQKLIMKSEWLRDAFNELDPSSEKVAFMFSPSENAPMPYNRYAGSNRRRTGRDAGGGEDDEEGEVPPIFRLEAIGTLGSTEMDYPNDTDVLETFECFQPCTNSYKFSHMQLTTKALAVSTKSMRTAEDGLLSFQFMIPFGGRSKGAEAKVCFVEFLCVALDEDY